MKQYRITSEQFVMPGESGHDDAVMDAADLKDLKRLAGLITENEGPSSPSVGGIVNQTDNVPNEGDSYSQSPVGSTVSINAKERRELEKEFCADPGSDLWFVINFTTPYRAGSLRSQVEKYLKDHPEARPRPVPGA